MKLEYLTNWDKQKLAERINIPRAILRELATDEEWRIRANVAKNPITPEDTLQDLVKDTYWRVREYVAKNSNSSSNILVSLFEYEKSFKKPKGEVIYAIYNNENLPIFVQRVIETLYGEWV